jgi:hypothetical protein
LSFFNEAIELTELVETLLGSSVMLSEDFGYFFSQRCDILWETGEVEESLCNLIFSILAIHMHAIAKKNQKTDLASSCMDGSYIDD